MTSKSISQPTEACQVPLQSDLTANNWFDGEDWDRYMAETDPGAPITIVSQRMLPAIHFPDGTVSYGYRCTKSCGHEDDYSIADGRAMGDMVGVRVESCGQCERGAL